MSMNYGNKNIPYEVSRQAEKMSVLASGMPWQFLFF